ncbi:MAG: hypothetical protein IKU45_03190, partial [Clostridia bacterium]|nr:hypothetical protein [Clostridia bacterium]
MQPIKFKRLCHGIYKSTTGPHTDSVLSLVGNISRLELVDDNYYECPEAPFPFEGVYVEKVNGKTVLCVPKNNDERFYGPGLRFRSIATNLEAMH